MTVRRASQKRMIKLDENPDIFITIIEKDRLDFIAFQDKMETDSQICGYAKKSEENPNEYMEMIVQERLIGEEIICYSLKEKEVITSWLDTDKE